MSITASRSIFFGWKVVATAFIVATFSFGIGYYGPSVFLNVLHEQRGWPLSIISAAITTHFLVSAVLVTRLPYAHRQFGVASVTLGGIMALAAGSFGWSIASAPWQLFVASVISGCGWAATSGAAIIAMVSPWFEQRRALALGHALNGASFGGVVFAPVWVVLIDTLGFTNATIVVGAVALAVLSPLALCYLRPQPEPAQAQPPPAPIASLMTNGALVTLSLSFALAMFAQVGVIAHLITRLAPQVGTGYAAMAVSVATACAVIGRLMLGALLGDADRRFAAACNFVMQACGVAVLALATTPVPLAIGCVLFGLGIGNLLTLPPLIAQREFKSVNVPQIVALVTAVNQTVFAFAPSVIGIISQAEGSYTLAFLVAAAVQLVAAAIILLGRASAASRLGMQRQ